jgi:DNA-binding GntR family transcriptional regulator
MTEKHLFDNLNTSSSEFLVDTAYKAILEAILDNELKPNAALSEPMLAKSLGISRTPTREAIKRLEEQGFVYIIPRRGAFVAEVKIQTVVEIYHIRELMECYAVEFVPQYGDPRELEELIKDVEASDFLIREGKLEEANQLDLRLHRYITHASQNKTLIELVDRYLLQTSLIRYRTPKLKEDRFLEMKQEHLSILYALRNQDIPAAQQALRHHFKTVCDGLVKDLRLTFN